MTTGFSATTLNGWLDTIRTGGANVTALTTAYVQLHTGDPGSAGTANVSVGCTTRASVTQTSPSGASMAVTGTAPSFVNAGTSETITHVSVFTASTVGTFKYSGALSASKAWASGDTLNLNTLTVALTPVAA